MAPSIPVLLAGDHFVLNRLLADALHTESGSDVWNVRELELPWPHEPFRAIAEVDEASGSEDALIDALRGVRVCLTQMAPLTSRVLEACPDLELFAVSRGGPVNANLDAATRHGVAVTYAPGRNAVSTAEHTLGLMLAAMRRIPDSHFGVLRGQWKSDLYAYDATGLQIDGTTVGLIGAGAVGAHLASVLIAMGARVLVHDPYVERAALPPGVVLVPLLELLARSEIVSLHARLTRQNHKLIGAAELGLMRDGAVLVNCARGGLLDYTALATALREGKLFAAGLDVYDIEPLPADHPIREAPNVVLTPHLAGATKAVARNAAAMVAEEAGRWLRGAEPAHCANPEVLPRLRRLALTPMETEYPR